jgi:hypothetical protein
MQFQRFIDEKSATQSAVVALRTAFVASIFKN